MSFGPIATRFCRMTGPSSSPGVGRKIVSPVSLRPRMIAQGIEAGPRCSGSSEGWNWIMPCFGIAQNSGGANSST